MPASTVRKRFAYQSTVSTIVILAIVAGGIGGFLLYRYSPQLATVLQHHTTQKTTSPKTHLTVNQQVQSLGTLLQGFNSAMTSYDAQPQDQSPSLRLIISNIGVNVPIVERGLKQGWLVVAPGEVVTHFVYSAYPGSPGNTILYSHANEAFRSLDKLSIHDTIVVQTPNGVIAYRVREIRIVDPSDLSVLNSTDSSVLTLLTCYPFGVDSTRFVVIADQV